MVANAPVVNMSANCSVVRTYRENGTVQIDWIKQPTQINTVGSRHVPQSGIATFHHDESDCFVGPL